MSAPPDINEKIVECVSEIFNSMVMMDVSSSGENLSSLGEIKDSITAVVGLAGTHRGVVAVHLPNRIARAVTSNFLGTEIEEINEEVRDAVGELANMVGGNIKTMLSDNGADIDLSMPSTIGGDSYFFEKPHDVDTVIVPFDVPDGTFHVELQMARQ